MLDLYNSSGVKYYYSENGDAILYRSMFFDLDNISEYRYIVDIIVNDKEKEFIYEGNKSSQQGAFIHDFLMIEDLETINNMELELNSFLSKESLIPNLDCVSDEILTWASSEIYTLKYDKYSSFIKVNNTKEICDYLYNIFIDFEEDVLIKKHNLGKGCLVVVEGKAYELLSILKKIELDRNILQSDTFNFEWMLSVCNVSDFTFTSSRKVQNNFTQDMLERPFYAFQIEALIS